jgi:FMN phosphatase YigB (HAD superfamily)
MSRNVVFDLDGTLCTQSGPDYEKAQPIPEAIEVVNRLYDDGYTILIYTARFMGRNKSDIHKTYHEGYEFTKRQVDGWGIRHHRLMMGKPPADIVIDDLAVFFTPDWNEIDKQIRDKVK